MHIDGTISRAWSEYVALLSEQEGGVLSLDLVTQGAILQSAILNDVIFHSNWIKSLFRVNTSVLLDNGYDLGAFFVEEPCKMITDITKTLNDHSFTFYSMAEIRFLTESIVFEKLPEDVEAAQASRFCSAINTSLTQELAGGAPGCMNLLLTIDV